MTSPLTNTRSGSFHKIELLNSAGVFQDLLSLLSSAGITTLTAAGGGNSITGTGTTRVLTVDLTSINTALAAKLETLTAAGGGITISGTGATRVLTVDLTPLTPPWPRSSKPWWPGQA